MATLKRNSSSRAGTSGGQRGGAPRTDGLWGLPPPQPPQPLHDAGAFAAAEVGLAAALAR